eukprot:4039899-Pyramimonas_sp.AAC.1
MEGGSFSKCGSRLRAAHIRFKTLQELHGLRVVPFQHAALALVALAPRTFVFKNYKSFTDSHDQRTKNGVWDGFRTTKAQ